MLRVAALSLAALLACSTGTPQKSSSDAEAKAEAWTGFAPGLPADSFPAPTRPTSDIVAPRWTDEGERDGVREAQLVMDAMWITRGMTVADVGAGDWYYVMRLADRIGPSGRVFGQDIVPEYLELLSQRVKKAQLGHVTVVRGEPHDPRLPADSLDAALLIHMYHEITDPFALLWNLATSLKPGAAVGILDTTNPTDRHGTPLALLDCELALVGYEKVRVVMLKPDEYLAIYRAPSKAARPSPAAIREAARTRCRG